MSERLLSLLPLPPIWEHKIRSVSYEDTKNLHMCFCVCVTLTMRVCARACVYVLATVALIVVPRQLDWKQTDKKHLKQKKRKKKKTRAHTTTCQERNASNFFVICQPFNKTRALCPHTPSSSHERQRWREEKEGRRRGKRRGWERDRQKIRYVFFLSQIIQLT